MTIKTKSWKARTQAIHQSLRDAEYEVTTIDPALVGVTRDGCHGESFVRVARPDGKRFWVAWLAKRTGPTGNETTTGFWTCYTDAAPTVENGPWYTWEYGGPGGPMMATLHKNEPPKGTKNVERYQNPMGTTEEKAVLRWFDTIIAAGIALRADHMRRPRSLAAGSAKERLDEQTRSTNRPATHPGRRELYGREQRAGRAGASDARRLAAGPATGGESAETASRLPSVSRPERRMPARRSKLATLSPREVAQSKESWLRQASRLACRPPKLPGQTDRPGCRINSPPRAGMNRARDGKRGTRRREPASQ